MPHVNKNFRSLTGIVSRLNFSLSRKQWYEVKKITLFSFHSSVLFGAQPTQNYFTRFIYRFNIHSNKSD